MLRLDRTTRKLQAVLAGAVTTNQLDIVVCGYDVPAQTKPDFSEYRGFMQVSSSNSTTDADICAAPVSQGVVRNLEYIGVYNKDTVSATVTIKLDDGGTEHILRKKQLLTTESLIWTRGAGWQVV